MSAAAKVRQAAGEPGSGIPSVLHADPGDPDVVRRWCTDCGLPDAPVGGWREPDPPCPRCGSVWRWRGRISDLNGTATGPPDDGLCLECFKWRRYGPGQEHFGWAWWRCCGPGLGTGERCAHEHHKDEVWLASA
jgi:hypothetical protein